MSAWQNLLLILGGSLMTGVVCQFSASRRRYRMEQGFAARLEAERSASAHLCFSTIEALTYAIEAADPYNSGHLDCVQRCVMAMARALNLPEEEAAALRAAALLHNIGRLGVPEHILLKADSLTEEEREKLRSHPVLGARILASIPFPWSVIPIVRHHAEHFDGGGYPDGLKSSAIPLGARVLAVANAYSALLRPRPYRAAVSPVEALAEIEARSGTQFDPAVVAAFRTVAAHLRAEAELDEYRKTAGAQTSAPVIRPQDEARAALDDIAAAQRETLGLLTLSQTVTESLHLEAVSTTLLRCVREMIPCAACVLFLPEKDAEYLRAQAALGLNARHLLGSMARIGTYLTGRAYTRGELMRATYLMDDLLLRDVSDVWTPFRSTLIVPLRLGGQSLGTLNLYAEEPDAFGAEAQRIMRLVATQAAKAVDNAQRFAAVQETAYTDALTGLKNARYLREYLERETNRAGREGASLAVLNLDLDAFKPINDRYGHSRGDEILREVAEILKSHIRNYDLAARYAGDEFVVVLTRVGRVQAEIVATKLKVALERYRQRLQERDSDFPPLGASIGIALYPEDATDIQGLLCGSDAAMYADKEARYAERGLTNSRRVA